MSLIKQMFSKLLLSKCRQSELSLFFSTGITTQSYAVTFLCDDSTLWKQFFFQVHIGDALNHRSSLTIFNIPDDGSKRLLDIRKEPTVIDRPAAVC